MLLYCVRHGESLYNAEGRVQGRADVSLSELGHRQAAALAEALADEQLDALYASPLARARQTAEYVARVTGLPIVLADDLMEIHVGVFQELLWMQIAEVHPEAAWRWHSRDPDYRIPGGESRRDLMLRGATALERIRDRGHRRAAVVAHGGILTAAFKALLGIPAERSPFTLSNASISRVGWEKAFQLLSLNETGHLLRLDASRYPRSGEL
jgi:2,3-bisphosphoglycerate-dependent phosphoglycerate mutase